MNRKRRRLQADEKGGRYWLLRLWGVCYRRWMVGLSGTAGDLSWTGTSTIWNVSSIRIYDEVMYRRKYRLSRSSMSKLTAFFADHGAFEQSKFKSQYPPERQVELFMRRLGQGSSMFDVADLSCSESYICRLEQKFFPLVLHYLKPELIRMPTEDEAKRSIEVFKGFSGFPGVVGPVDGTFFHTKNFAPGKTDWFSRKQHYALHAQVCINHNLEYIDTVVGWPGSVHDSRVFKTCSLFNGGHGPFPHRPDWHLLADSGYPLLRWVMTPWRKHTTRDRRQKRFNKRLSATRVWVEVAIGLTKLWFKICANRMLTPDLKKAVQTVVVCLTLHNFKIRYDGVDDDEIEELVQELGGAGEEDDDPLEGGGFAGADGSEKRDKLADMFMVP